jgi:Ca2+-transporting ATPase
VLANLALIFANRSRGRTPWAALLAPNATLWIVTGATLGFLALSLYLPWLAGVFRFAPLSLAELATAFGLALGSVSGLEAIKQLRRFTAAREKA